MLIEQTDINLARRAERILADRIDVRESREAYLLHYRAHLAVVSRIGTKAGDTEWAMYFQEELDGSKAVLERCARLRHVGPTRVKHAYKDATEKLRVRFFYMYCYVRFDVSNRDLAEDLAAAWEEHIVGEFEPSL